MSGALMLHRLKSLSHQVQQWCPESASAYNCHRLELAFEDGSTFSISLFTTDLALSLQQLPARIMNQVEQDPDPTPWCNACGARMKERCDCGPIADNE